MAGSWGWVAAAMLLVPAATPADAAAQTEPSASVRDRVFDELRGALQRLGASEEAFRDRVKSYASSTWELAQQDGWSEVEGTTAIVVDADDSSWSAAAFSRALPGLRCTVGPRRIGEPAAEATCTGNADYLVLNELVPSPFEIELRNTNRMAAQCPSQIASRATGRVLIEFTLDNHGEPDFAGVRITESSDIRLSYVAIQMLSRCKFSPAEIDGHKVRSRRVSPFNIVAGQ